MDRLNKGKQIMSETKNITKKEQNHIKNYIYNLIKELISSDIDELSDYWGSVHLDDYLYNIEGDGEIKFTFDINICDNGECLSADVYGLYKEYNTAEHWSTNTSDYLKIPISKEIQTLYSKKINELKKY
tara:strand:- start:21 stop:407 length:387 start_codon:yes stop_codon:yes gene_type:complete